MDISATYVFDAPAEKVWITLMDPASPGRVRPRLPEPGSHRGE